MACFFLTPSQGKPDDDGAFRPVQIVQPFEAIRNPPHVSADRATKHIEDDELVLGVNINGQARAYPINTLTGPAREIINDTLGGKDIAATW